MRWRGLSAVSCGPALAARWTGLLLALTPRAGRRRCPKRLCDGTIRLHPPWRRVDEFRKRPDAVAITSTNGEAIVPGALAIAAARAEANATGKAVTVRDPITDKVPAFIRPTSKQDRTYILALLTLALLTGAASAQQRRLYDASGRAVVRSVTGSNGGVTNYGTDGRVISRETASSTTGRRQSTMRTATTSAGSQHPASDDGRARRTRQGPLRDPHNTTGGSASRPTRQNSCCTPKTVVKAGAGRKMLQQKNLRENGMFGRERLRQARSVLAFSRELALAVRDARSAVPGGAGSSTGSCSPDEFAAPLGTQPEIQSCPPNRRNLHHENPLSRFCPQSLWWPLLLRRRL